MNHVIGGVGQGEGERDNGDSPLCRARPNPCTHYNVPMKVIAITGGPCAGKTSAMGVLCERLEHLGIPALFISEAATELILAGIAPWTCSSMLEFQTHVIARQLEHEAAVFEEARSADVAAVICDRGICDSHAYLSDDEYSCALDANGVDHERALARYDAVFHLDSIAKDHPEAYTRDNNGARFENAEEAALVNERVVSAWTGHPSFRVIGNHASFDEKADALFEGIIRCIDAGEPDSPILVSACLLGEPCRYDGKAQPCPAVIEMAQDHELVTVCPEQLGGLPTPRTPSEIQAGGRVINTLGEDNTAAFEAGAHEALRIARERGCKRAILKENSPSCGVHRVYDGTFTGMLVPGSGKTAALLSEAGIMVSGV